MKKDNLILEIVDKILSLKKDKKLLEENSLEKTLNKKYPGYIDEVKISLRLNQLFDVIKSSEKRNQKENYFESLSKKIDYSDFSKNSISQKLSFKRKVILRIAVIFIPFALLSSIYLIYFKGGNSADNSHTVSTLKGSKTKIVLEDGTKIWLNAESEFSYPSTFENTDKRIVYLIGEAFFDVTENEKKPFEVILTGYKVNVLGTSFNIKAYPEENKIEATLEQGKVNIEKIDEADSMKSHKMVSLEPNQTIIIYNDGKLENSVPEKNKGIALESPKTEVSPKKQALLLENIDISPYISWKENKLVFRNESLFEITKDLERWYNIEITISDESLNEIKFSATFVTETAEQAIHALCVASKLNYEFIKNNVIIKAN